MPGTRVSTTVDEHLLKRVRDVRPGSTDAGYAAYDDHPIDEPDEWGDLASFHDAARAS
jgi:hypothetical protein